MRVVTSALLAITGLYAYAVFGPVGLTREGLVWGLVIVFGILMAALVALGALEDDD